MEKNPDADKHRIDTIWGNMRVLLTSDCLCVECAERLISRIAHAQYDDDIPDKDVVE